MIASSILKTPWSLRIYHHFRCSVFVLPLTLKGDLYFYLALHRKNFQIITLKPPTKMQPKMSSAKVVCCIWFPDVVDLFWVWRANVVDPDRAAPKGAVWSGSTLFVNEASKHFCRREKQTTFFAVIGASRVNSDNAWCIHKLPNL